MILAPRLLTLAPILVLLLAAPLSAQESTGNRRRGLWGGVGAGLGLLGCLESGCSHGDWGFTGHVQLGGTVSPSLRLGGATYGLARSLDDEKFEIGTLTFIAQWYPGAGDFFLLGGAGLAYVEVGGPVFGFNFSGTDVGAGFVASAGYDISMSRYGWFALTPFASWIVTTLGPTFDFFQVGVGLTIH
jgi:hypothetical protein